MTAVDHAVDQPTIAFAEWRETAVSNERQDAVRRAVVAVTDAVATVSVAAALSATMDTLPLRIAMTVPIGWTIVAWSVGAYHHQRLKMRLIDPQKATLTAMVLVAIAGLVAALAPMGGIRPALLAVIPLTTVAVCTARAVLMPFTKSGARFAPAPVVLVGPEAQLRAFAANQVGARAPRVAGVYVTDRRMPPWDAEATAHAAERAVTEDLARIGLDRIRTLSDLVPTVRSTGADTVVVVGDQDTAVLRELAWQLEPLGVGIAVAPLWLVAPHRVSVRNLGGSTVIEVSPPRYYGTRVLLRECVDRTIAVLALLLLSPLFLALAILVKAGSPDGPVLFSQLRTGKGGRRFKLLKFRTMVPNAEELKAQLTSSNEYGEGTLFKMRSDPRITPIGRWLRRFSLDELPQLLNVARGDMLLVGPRPTSTPPEQMRPDYYRRTMVKPGLTGLWQVSGRSDLSWEDAVRLDVDYVENRSVELDLDILLRRTLPAVLGRRGAY